jgi:hypothetical protein
MICRLCDGNCAVHEDFFSSPAMQLQSFNRQFSFNPVNCSATNRPCYRDIELTPVEVHPIERWALSLPFAPLIRKSS